MRCPCPSQSLLLLCYFYVKWPRHQNKRSLHDRPLSPNYSRNKLMSFVSCLKHLALLILRNGPPLRKVGKKGGGDDFSCARTLTLWIKTPHLFPLCLQSCHLYQISRKQAQKMRISVKKTNNVKVKVVCILHSTMP